MLKNRLGAACATILLAAIVIFLAVDVGVSLYQPDRLAEESPECTLNVISGDIKVQTNQSITWESAEDGMTLEPGTRIRTGSGSHASLTFSEGTTTKLEPGTDVIIAKLEGEQDAGPDLVVLEQRSGKTWNQVAPRDDDDTSFRIKTSSADVEVHGTSFLTEVDESGKTLVQTMKGQVNVSAEGEEVAVAAGKQTEVEPGVAPSAPVSIPPARNELVFTVDEPAIGMVIDPSGSRVGYLSDGSSLNQITGSMITPSEESQHNISIREPETGEYTIILHGMKDGDSSLGIEGYAQGNNTFSHSAACNITAANDLVLRLHLDVIDGLLQGAEVLGLESSGGPAVISTTLKTTIKKPDTAMASFEAPDGDINISGEDEKSEKESAGFHREGASPYYQRIFISVVVIALAVVGAIVWRKH